jgi:predicted nuclease of predicted toxin-antitoxin system
MNGILVDENLPADLRLPSAFPVRHVAENSNSPTDSSVWQQGVEGRLIIVTKDADFRHRILMSEPPPWIVHVRVGNLRLRPFIEHLTSVWPIVESMLPKHKLISIFIDRIEAIE